MKTLVSLIAVGCLIAGAAAASAGGDLSKDKEINDGLLIMAVAEKIQRECSSIGGRLGRARSFASKLEEQAMARGYTKAEIDAYVRDDYAKYRVREKRNDYFQSKGASDEDAASLCVLGRDEIARGSSIGYLLRAK
ncbi:MAG: DUF5333 domain-containing protein [Roseovarius sp.]